MARINYNWYTKGKFDRKNWRNTLDTENAKAYFISDTHFNHKNFTILFVDGNHENYTRLYNDYPVEEWHGGKVHKIGYMFAIYLL